MCIIVIGNYCCYRACIPFQFCIDFVTEGHNELPVFIAVLGISRFLCSIVKEEESGKKRTKDQYILDVV